MMKPNKNLKPIKTLNPNKMTKPNKTLNPNKMMKPNTILKPYKTTKPNKMLKPNKKLKKRNEKTKDQLSTCQKHRCGEDFVNLKKKIPDRRTRRARTSSLSNVSPDSMDTSSIIKVVARRHRSPKCCITLFVRIILQVLCDVLFHLSMSIIKVFVCCVLQYLYVMFCFI